jgi:hypothetical protein
MLSMELNRLCANYTKHSKKNNGDNKHHIYNIDGIPKSSQNVEGFINSPHPTIMNKQHN